MKMKKNHITITLLPLLLILLILLMPGFLIGGKPDEEDRRKTSSSDCKIILTINIDPPKEMIDESLQKQLDYFAKVAAIVNKKNQRRFFMPFGNQSKKEIAQWLLKASEIEKDDCFKNYLEVLSENILEKNRFSTDLPRWVDLEENQAEIIFVGDDRYQWHRLLFKTFFSSTPNGFNLGENCVFNTVIYLNLPDDTQKFEEYTTIFAEMQDNLPRGPKQEMPYSPLIPSFKISQLIFSSRPSEFSLVYPDITDEPASEKYGEEKGFKIIVFKNLINAYFEEVLKPISGRVLTDERLWDVDCDSYLSNIIMRRISHHLGPVFMIRDEDEEDEDEKYLDEEKLKKRRPKKKKKKKEVKELKTIPEILKDSFPIIEAVKSQMIALHNTSVLIKNGLISEDKDINIYTTYLVSLIDQLRRSPRGVDIRRAGKISFWDTILEDDKSENFLSALIQFNFLLQQEGIIFNINSQKIDVDPLKFKDAVEKLTGDILRLLGNPTYSTAKRFIDQKVVFPPQLKEILISIEEVPLAIEFHLEQEEVN
jgi:hypothetical protein